MDQEHSLLEVGRDRPVLEFQPSADETNLWVGPVEFANISTFLMKKVRLRGWVGC